MLVFYCDHLHVQIVSHNSVARSMDNFDDSTDAVNVSQMILVDGLANFLCVFQCWAD